MLQGLPERRVSCLVPRTDRWLDINENNQFQTVVRVSSFWYNQDACRFSRLDTVHAASVLLGEDLPPSLAIWVSDLEIPTNFRIVAEYPLDGGLHIVGRYLRPVA